MSSESPDPGTPPPGAPKTSATLSPGGSNRNLTGLKAYVAQYHGTFTDEALTDKLLTAGYSPADIQAALAAVASPDAASRVRASARRLVLGAYGITYALLVLGMLTNGSPSVSGAGGVGTVVLTVTLGLALAISLAVVRRSRGRGADPGVMLAAVLAIPVVLLIVVAGACLATGLPIPRG